MRSQSYADPVARRMPLGGAASPTLRDCPQGHLNPCGHPYCGKCGEQLAGTPPPMWTDPAEAMAVIRHPPHLRKTLLTTVIVGTVLFCINQLDVVLAGDAHRDRLGEECAHLRRPVRRLQRRHPHRHASTPISFG